jgi:sodium-dependent dicarboxylate transporter 2/3/5
MGTGVVMGLTLFFWFVFGEEYGIANIAIIAIVVLFVFNLITWQKVEEHVNWAIILMYGGAICLGEVMADSGAALWLAQKVFAGTVQSPMVFLFALAILSAVFTTFMNNSAVIAVLLPPAISLSPDYGISSAVAAMTVILPSNFAFILPIATPASALAYSSRCFSLREMVVSGVLLAMVGMACYALLLMGYWPLVGFSG